MPDFVPGRELSGAFYGEVVGPLLADVPHSSALLGTGSDVLGFDTPRSTDHGWGPRLLVFVAPERVTAVRRILDEGLPAEFRGWPTWFGWDDVPVSHHVQVATLRDWLLERLGFDPREGVDLREWLRTPQEILLEVTSGAVYRDDADELASVRDALAWYPDDAWLWLLACQWRRIDQEEPFVGRTAEVGDDLGSRIVAARLVRDVVRLCFLLERRYAPYSKWLFSAFRELDSHRELADAVLSVLGAVDFRVREEGFVEVMRAVAARHNELRITAPVDESVGFFHGRPFRVLGSSRFVEACLERVSDRRLRSLPLVGGIDQFADSTDVLSAPPSFQAVSALYDAWLGEAGDGAATSPAATRPPPS
jgi:hypothetical protein